MLLYVPSVVEIKDKIIELIRQQQEEYGQALLSVVGLELSKHFKRPFKHISSEPSLTAFIRKFMEDEVDLFPREDDPLVLYARLRAEASAERKSSSQAAISEVAVPRYDASFWAAFAKPLTAGHERFVRRQKPFHFVDLPLGSPSPPEEYIPVDANFITPAELVDRAARSQFILKQIDAWLEKNSLKPDDFLRPRSSASLSSERIETIPIVRILTGLQPSDLERLILPADLWLKLLTVKDR